MITLNNLNKIYSNGVHALKDVNLSFKEKGLFFIIGKSGSVIITWILSIVSIMILNDYFDTRFRYLISFTSYSFREVIFVLLISVVNVLVATTYPVIKYARKNPMDSIRDIL